MLTTIPFLFLFSTTQLAASEGDVLRIHDASELITFSDNVNGGTLYSGTTVYLDSDIEFTPELSRQFKPIGKNTSRYFRGTFDGQGHTVSNLVMNSLDTNYAGLFGASYGLTIRNIVIGSSCSITSSYNSSSSVAYVGGIIGYCASTYGDCNIENSVNMASVSFNGESSDKTYLGGISGSTNSVSTQHGSSVNNCANYGSVTHSGSSSSTYIGGIIGYSYHSSFVNHKTYYRNCLNYGTLTHNGTTATSPGIGGIVGYERNIIIKNCVSAGAIVSTSSDGRIGSIVGESNTKISGASGVTEGVNHTFWTNDVDYDMIGSGDAFTGIKTYKTELNSTLVTELSSYSESNGWNKWLLNRNNASVSFRVNDGKGFAVASQLILLPSLVDNSERTFSGWYRDEFLTLPFTDSEVNSSTALYGLFCGSSNYTATFDVNGGNEIGESEKEMSIECNGMYGVLPAGPTMTGYTFTGWFTERRGGSKVEPGSRVGNPNNHTLYAQWIANNYTVTLDANGGDGLGVKEVVVMFNSTYGHLPTPTRSGYTFLGWFTDKNESVTSVTVVITPGNHILHAHWEVPTNQVEIVFGTKDLSEKEIKDVIQKYVGDDTSFTIIGYENVDETGEMKVIIKFNDVENAQQFYERIQAILRDTTTNHLIRRVIFISSDISFSLVPFPSLLYSVVL